MYEFRRKKKTSQIKKKSLKKTNTINFFFRFWIGWGENGDEFDTSYSIQTAEDKEYMREKQEKAFFFVLLIIG